MHTRLLLQPDYSSLVALAPVPTGVFFSTTIKLYGIRVQAGELENSRFLMKDFCTFSSLSPSLSPFLTLPLPLSCQLSLFLLRPYSPNTHARKAHDLWPKKTPTRDIIHFLIALRTRPFYMCVFVVISAINTTHVFVVSCDHGTPKRGIGGTTFF